MIINVSVVRGGLKSKAQSKVSLASEGHRMWQRSNLSVQKRVCPCEWLPRPYPKTLMEKKQHS